MLGKLGRFAGDKFLPANKQGLVLDGVVTLLYLLVMPFFGGYVEEVWRDFLNEDAAAFRLLGIVAGVVIVARYVGLYLKRLPLQFRLVHVAEGKKKPPPLSSANVKGSGWLAKIRKLNGVIWILSFVSILLCLIIFATWLMKVFDVSMDVGVYFILPVLFVLVIIEWVFYSSLTDSLSDEMLQAAEQGHWRFSRLTEYGANLLLFSFILFFQGFYSVCTSLYVNAVTAGVTANDFTSALLPMLLVIIVFLLFYLPPRAMFLLEDIEHKGTWASIALVFAASVFAVLI